jgi:hypothetical protein
MSETIILREKPPRIDLGQTGWKIEGEPYWVFGSKERAEAHRTEQKLEGEIHYIDTRPTLEEVGAQIRKLESERLGCDSKWTCGPWDEYFSVGEMTAHGRDVKSKWPNDYFWVAVYVVTGGSEGLYLHVDITNRPSEKTAASRKTIMLGKTCDSSFEKWQACWESAGWIAYYLGA